MIGQYVLGYISDFYEKGYPEAFESWDVEIMAIYYVAPGETPELIMHGSAIREQIADSLNQALSKGREQGLREAHGVK